MARMRFVLQCLLVCFLCGLSWGEKIKVAVAGSPPFVLQDSDGIAVDVWGEIARGAEIDYEMVHVPHVVDALELVRSGKAQVAVGSISITADRARHVAFSQPYFEASLALLSRTGHAGLWQRVRPFFSKAFLVGLGSILVLLVLVGTLIWLLERRTNSSEFPKGSAGIGAGMWFAIVTMTTVGYGDKSPKTIPGRVLAAIWMVIATVTYSTLTAGIGAALALVSIDTGTFDKPELLLGQQVATVVGTTGEEAAIAFGGKLVVCDSLEDGVEKVRQKAADVLVFDHPALEYYLQKHPNSDLTLSKSHFMSQNYGFAVALESPLGPKIDVQLLRLHESGKLAKLTGTVKSPSSGR